MNKLYTLFVAVTLIFNRCYTADVIYDDALCNQFSPFCTNVLRVQTAPEWDTLVKNIKKECSEKPDAEIFYRQLQSSYAAIKPLNYQYKLYQSLKFQALMLSEQIKKLCSEDIKKIDGYVEIGSACRYADYVHEWAPITGTRYAIHEGRKLTDVFEGKNANIRRGFVPYDTMLSLNNYAPLAPQDIPNESVDMVTCFIGLHHLPTDKLDAFILSIKRILRPGGTFLLRDHDAQTPELCKIASAAHTVFNALIDQVSLEDEIKEIRNFKPLIFWIELLEKHGFDSGSERIVQEGDSTINTLIRCTKKVVSEDEFVKKITRDRDYARHALQTFLTAPEWYNVDCSQAYGTYLEHTAWFNFPYWQSIKTYWHLFNESFKQARTTNSLPDILKSDYFSMSLFMGAFMTVEYAAKGLVALPVARMVGAADTKISIVIDTHNTTDLTYVPQEVVIKDRFKETVILEVPRYAIFQKTIALLAQNNAEIREIAGNKVIQVKIRSADNQEGRPTDEKLSRWTNAHSVTLSYTWRVPTRAYTYGSLMLPVEKLPKLIQEAQLYDFEVVYIHDF